MQREGNMGGRLSVARKNFLPFNTSWEYNVNYSARTMNWEWPFMCNSKCYTINSTVVCAVKFKSWIPISNYDIKFQTALAKGTNLFMFEVEIWLPHRKRWHVVTGTGSGLTASRPPPVLQLTGIWPMAVSLLAELLEYSQPNNKS